MDLPFLRPLLLAFCLASGPGLLVAADPSAPAAGTKADGPKSPAAAAKPAEAAATKPAETGGDKAADGVAAEATITMPTIQVTQSRIHDLEVAIAKLDKLIAREEKKVKTGELDRALNNAQLAHAAAIFGGNSAEHLSAVAASRVALLQAERDVLESMKRPGTAAALAMLETELEQLRTTRRNLDNVQRESLPPPR